MRVLFVLLAEEENYLENDLDRINRIMNEKEMKLNKNKRKIMMVSRNKNTNHWILR